MASRTVFSDESNNEMDCYINDQGKIFLSISQKGEDIVHSGWITLDKEDTQNLIKILNKFVEEMN